MKDFKKPKFITFEGGEGSGKTTQSKMLYEYFLSKGEKVVYTREVGGTPEAEKIRDILIYSDLLPISELMLVTAARYEHVHKVITPAILEGYLVICDRFVDSTACYQSGASGLTIDDIYNMHDKFMRINHNSTALMPDITFFMDVPPDLGIERVSRRGDINKFDQKDLAFHKVIYERFKYIAETYKDRIISIESSGKSITDIHKSIVSFCEKYS